jgi:signal transduction histidine kinase
VGSFLYRRKEQIQTNAAIIEVAEPLPEVKANREAVTEILGQLLDNSLKFSSPGIHPKIRIWATNGTFLRVNVQDNGIGIKPEYHDRIFRVFEKLHPYSLYPGTGIGLAIVRKAVERMLNHWQHLLAGATRSGKQTASGEWGVGVIEASLG